MDRRQYLACGCAGLSTLAAGCLDAVGGADCADPWDPGISGEEPSLARGASGSVRIEAARAMRLSLGIPELDGGNVEVDVAGASVSPSPDAQADSYPPIWYWDDCTGVDVVVPVEVAADADPGEYVYSVTAGQGEDHGGETVTREFVLTVVDG